jgi:polyhydroxybutyrate depolymerase
MLIERQRTARAPLRLLLLSGALAPLLGCSPQGPGEARAPEPVTTAPAASLAPIAAVAPAATATPEASALLAARPYKLDVPKGHDAERPAPLLLLLHPYGVTSEQFIGLMGVRDLAQERGFVLVSPEGQTDRDGKTFWVATDACCDFWDKGGDDIAYLSAVLADVRSKFAIDPARFYAVGYSNGGFMAERLACELPELTAVIDLVGGGTSNPAACRPKGPVSILKIHGDRDEIVFYEGGQVGGPLPKRGRYPSARDDAAAWAARNGCSGATDKTAPPLDLDATIPGAETSAEKWLGCRPGGDVELWTVHGAGHVWKRQPALPRLLMDFLAAHPRPKSGG